MSQAHSPTYRRPDLDRTGEDMDTEHVETVIVGGGQAGLATGYFLRQRGVPFVILDAEEHVGDVWRRRWDSLRLFTYARYAGLPGLRFPAPAWSFPTKDEMADYLERYAQTFELNVRSGVRVESLSRDGDRFVLMTRDRRYEANNVIVATGSHRIPKVPPFAGDLDPSIVQLHSSEYRRPSQLRDGGVLLVGAGNSGADIAMDVVRGHPAFLSGRDTGQVPVRIERFPGKVAFPVVRFLLHHVVTRRTPIGRRKGQQFIAKGDPRVRVKAKDLEGAGVERVPRVAGVRDGRPVLEDGRILDVTNVIWCTGFRHDFPWIDLPVFDEHRDPLHRRGVVESAPGLYFVGLVFQYSLASCVLPGIGRDHAYVADHLATRRRERTTPATARSAAAA
jgi:putative flavoprotein involved in K+ transport